MMPFRKSGTATAASLATTSNATAPTTRSRNFHAERAGARTTSPGVGIEDVSEVTWTGPWDGCSVHVMHRAYQPSRLLSLGSERSRRLTLQSRGSPRCCHENDNAETFAVDLPAGA